MVSSHQKQRKRSMKLCLFRTMVLIITVTKDKALKPKYPEGRLRCIIHNGTSSGLCPQAWLFLRKGTNKPQRTSFGSTLVLSPPGVHRPPLFIYKVRKVLKQGVFSDVVLPVDWFGIHSCPRKRKCLTGSTSSDSMVVYFALKTSKCLEEEETGALTLHAWKAQCERGPPYGAPQGTSLRYCYTKLFG